MTNEKKITCAQSVEIAMLLYEENINQAEITNMIKIANISLSQDMLPLVFSEWKAFVHAAIVYSLMHHAPAVVACEYIKNIKALMGRHDNLEDENSFIDNTFSAYMKCFVEDAAKECPQIFIKKILNININDCSLQTVKVVSGVMALTISNILDKIELVEMMAD